MNEEEKNIDIREKLLKLPKIKASEGFESELLRKINLAEAEDKALKHKTETESGKGFLGGIFTKKRAAWLVPAFSLGIIAIIAFTIFIVNSNRDINIQETASELKNDSDSRTQTLESNKPIAKDEKAPGKEVTNDLDIGKRDELSRRDVTRGYMEQEGQTSPKKEEKREEIIKEFETKGADVKISTEKETGKDLKKTESKPEKKADDVIRQEEAKSESPREKAAIPPSNKLSEDKDDKKKEEKSEKEKLDKKKMKGIKEISIDILEEIKKKVTDNK